MVRSKDAKEAFDDLLEENDMKEKAGLQKNFVIKEFRKI